jgi:hypothetical protein
MTSADQQRANNSTKVRKVAIVSNNTMVYNVTIAAMYSKVIVATI